MAVQLLQVEFSMLGCERTLHSDDRRFYRLIRCGGDRNAKQAEEADHLRTGAGAWVHARARCCVLGKVPCSLGWNDLNRREIQ